MRIAPHGLYIHIPFCVRKCFYCDFYSLELKEGPISERLKSKEIENEDFLNALGRELQSLPNEFAPATIFVGGGTPTELSETDFARLFELIHRHIALHNVTEWTVESNPGTLTRNKASIMKRSGVTRVSLGVQSLNDELLNSLGRIHTAPEAIEGYHLLRDVGFDDINLDFIFAVPGGSMETLKHDLHQVHALQPEHTSWYCLMFEDGTPMTTLKNGGFIQEVDDDIARDQYEFIRTALTGDGYEQYEISNFSKPGKACVHNILYWQSGNYLGCGPAAHSHWEGKRFGNKPDLRAYTKTTFPDPTIRSFEEALSNEDKARETFIFALRYAPGFSESWFFEKTGFRFDELFNGQLREAVNSGHLIRNRDSVQLSPDAFFISDHVFSQLV